MPIYSSAGGGGERQPVPVGNHPAICISLIEIGTIKESFAGGEAKERQKINIGFEFPDFTMEHEGILKPMTLFRIMTNSLAASSNLRPMLESWRGRPFTAEELQRFDLENLLGVAGMVNVTHSQDGRFANIQTITPLPKSITAPTPQHTIQKLSYDSWSQDIFEGLPDFIKDMMRRSKEYQEKFGAALPGEGPGHTPNFTVDGVKPVMGHLEPREQGEPLPDSPPF